MADTQPKKTDSFQQILDSLVDADKIFPPVYLHRFSDISPEDLKALKAIWEKVPQERRVALLEDLEDLYDSDTIMSFEDIGRMAITDSHPSVRAGALRLLWDYQGRDLIPIYQFLLEKDPDEIVRAQAASLLGQFIYLGELEEIPSETLHVIEDCLLQIVESAESKLVRRRALESLGYSSRDEVPAIILNAFDSGDFHWMASALFAMGRSTDETWTAHVLKMLDHQERDVQLEAIRAAGMLELEEARTPLLRMAKSGSEDADLRGAIAWSLSQIGGEQVGVILEKLLTRAEDDEEAEFIQSAIENLEFKQGSGDFGLFDVPAARRNQFHVVRPSKDSDDGDGIPDEGNEILEESPKWDDIPGGYGVSEGEDELEGEEEDEDDLEDGDASDGDSQDEEEI